MINSNDATSAYVFLSKHDEDLSIEFFCNIYKKRLDSIRQSLEDSFPKVKGTYVFTDFFSFSVPRGLLNILTGENTFGGEYDRNSGLFFLYYFRLEYASSDEQGAKSLKGKFDDALNNIEKFGDFFFELAMANSYRSYGCAVEFVPPSKLANVNTPDLLVKSKVGDLWIECKCMTSTSRMPVEMKTISNCFEIIIDNFFSSVELAKHVLKATYKGARKDRDDEIVDELIKAINEIKQGRKRVSNALWNLDLSRHSIANISETIVSPWKEIPYDLRGLAYVPLRNENLIVLFSKEDSNLQEPVQDRIRKALKQLPSEGMRMVCIQFRDTSPYSSDLQDLSNWLFSYPRIQKIIKKNVAKNNGFLGVFFSGPFGFQDRNDKKFINYLQTGCGPNSEADMALYWLGIVGLSTQQFTEKVMSWKKV